MIALTERTRLGLEIVAVGAVSGLAGDMLLREMPWGLNVTLCTTLLVAEGVWLARRHGVKPGPDAPWLAITALLLGAAFLRRDAAVLTTFDALALVLTLALGAASLQREWISNWYPWDYVRGVVTAAAGSIFGGLLLVGSDVKWRELPQEGRLKHVRAALLGVIIATPLLLVFAALLASADPIFNNVLTNLFDFDISAVVSHTVFICFWGALVAGYLRWGLLGRPMLGFAPEVRTPGTIVPLATALGLLDALFLLFVVVQLRYFFGGAALVEATSGLTYAEYARKGFFELVAASGLVLPVLLGAEALIRGGTPAQLRLFRQLAGLLLSLLVVIMASALERMRLYVDAFGLSATRLYATAFMILLVGIFAWFGWTVLRGRRQRFAFGALMQAFAVLAGLHVLNPDPFIVRTNLKRPAAERPFDAEYVASLSADAVPVLLEALPRLSIADRCTVAGRLSRRWNGENAPDWRTWNWSRGRARQLVRQAAGSFPTSCPKPSKEQHHDH
jgi:hypothetical protein